MIETLFAIAIIACILWRNARQREENIAAKRQDALTWEIRALEAK